MALQVLEPEVEVENLNRITPRYLPRVTLRTRPLLQAKPLYRFWMLGELQRQVQTPPGRASGARWIKLDDEKTDYDGMPGMPSSHKPYALACGCSIEWVPTAVGGRAGWRLFPSPEEELYRQLDRAAYQNEIDRLQEEIDGLKASGKEHEEETEQLEAMQDLLAEIAPGEPGYFNTAYSPMGTNASGILYSLKAPNIPMACESTFEVEAARAVSFRLERAKAPENAVTLDRQARHEWRLFLFNEVGAKSTCYALVLGEDGNACEFWHFRNMGKGKREKLLAEMCAVEDRGRLSAADQHTLLDLENKEQIIRAGAKARATGQKKLSTDESQQIEALKEQAQKLKDSKKLTEADQGRIDELKALLFLAQESFRLQEDAQELIGKPIDFTISFLQSGYITIASQGSEWVYENRRLTGASPAIYASALPKGCRLRVESDGGKWGLVYGHPKYTRASLWSQPFEIDREFDPAEVEWYFGGDTGPSGGIETSLVPVRAASVSPEGILRPGTWQLRVDLLSQGTHSPELYWVEMVIPPGAREEPALVWDSQNPGNPDAPSGNWIMDVLLQSERERGPHATVHVATPELKPGRLPLLLAGLACDVSLYDRQDLRTVPLLRSGKVVVNPRERTKALTESGGLLACVPDVGAQVAFEVVGAQEFLNAECEVPFVLNGQFPNDCLRDLCFYSGLEESLYGGIPEGDIGLPRIALEQPGRFPEGKIAQGTRTLEAMRHILAQHCPGWQLITDTGGLTLIEHAGRDKTQRSYGLPPQVDRRSKLCLRGEWHLTQDISDTLTSVTVLGAINPATGVRYSAREEIPQMFWPGFESSMFWVGEERHELCAPDDGLKSDDACLRVARERLGITPLAPDGLTPWTAEIELDLDPELREGDLILVFGVRFLVDRIGFASLAAERDSQKMSMSIILAEDRRVTPQVLGGAT